MTNKRKFHKEHLQLSQEELSPPKKSRTSAGVRLPTQKPSSHVSGGSGAGQTTRKPSSHESGGPGAGQTTRKPPSHDSGGPGLDQPTRKRKSHQESKTHEPKRYKPSLGTHINLRMLGRLLKAAVRNDQFDLVKQLLRCGADPKVHNGKDGGTALHVVQSAPIAKLLLSAGADINSRDYDGLTPLHSAVEAFKGHKRQREVVDVFLAQEDIDIGAITESQRWTPLHYAASARFSMFLVPLLKHEETIRTRQLVAAMQMPSQKQDIFGSTPLHLYVRAYTHHFNTYITTIPRFRTDLINILQATGETFLMGEKFRDALGCVPSDYLYDFEARDVTSQLFNVGVCSESNGQLFKRLFNERKERNGRDITEIEN